MASISSSPAFRFIYNFLFYLLAVVALFFMANWLVRQMIYPAPSIPVGPPPPGLIEVEFQLSDKSTSYGWLHRNPKAASDTPVMLFFHGNGENLQTMALSGILDDFKGLGVHFLAMDYPGYGKNGGTSSEASLVEAADSAFLWIAENFFENPKIIFGWSLGAGVAFQSAAKYHHLLDGLIAVSPWSSLPDVAAAHYPRWLVKAALSEKYNSVEAAGKIQSPALVIHGEQDRIIPSAQGQRVSEALSNSTLVLLPGTGHNDVFSRQQTWQAIATFLGESKK